MPVVDIVPLSTVPNRHNGEVTKEQLTDILLDLMLRRTIILNGHRFPVLYADVRLREYKHKVPQHQYWDLYCRIEI